MINNGKISGCAHTGCNRTCCEFKEGNYILLYPGELDEAYSSGKSTAHLSLIDGDYHGGQKAVCAAKNAADCDKGYKPLDCQSYPFFPASGNVDELIKGKKCPLQESQLETHAEIVKDAWRQVCERNPEVVDFLDNVELVGYTTPVRHQIPAEAQKRVAARVG
ncbi:MAG: hypothetical protein WC521_07810 [Bdellovibrionales bacterium]